MKTVYRIHEGCERRGRRRYYVIKTILWGPNNTPGREEVVFRSWSYNECVRRRDELIKADNASPAGRSEADSSQLKLL